MDRLLVLVQVVDEVHDPALVAELGAAAFAAQVGDGDPQPRRQEGGLAHPLLEGGEVVLEVLEDLGVGEEGDRRPGLARRLPALGR